MTYTTFEAPFLPLKKQGNWNPVRINYRCYLDKTLYDRLVDLVGLGSQQLWWTDSEAIAHLDRYPSHQWCWVPCGSTDYSLALDEFNQSNPRDRCRFYFRDASLAAIAKLAI